MNTRQPRGWTFDLTVTRPWLLGLRYPGRKLLEDVRAAEYPRSRMENCARALKAITRSESYLGAMKACACRYDTEGYVTEHTSLE